MKTLRKNDKGISLRLRVRDNDGNVINISGATTKTLYFNKPDNTTTSKTASFYTDGTDGIVSYTTETDFLDTIGIWEIEVHLVIGAGSFRSTKVKFRVEETIG